MWVALGRDEAVEQWDHCWGCSGREPSVALTWWFCCWWAFCLVIITVGAAVLPLAALISDGHGMVLRSLSPHVPGEERGRENAGTAKVFSRELVEVAAFERSLGYDSRGTTPAKIKQPP